MADFEKVIRKHVNDEGSIPADSIQGLAQAIADYVGKNFVDLNRYNTKKALADDLQEKLDASEKYKTDYDKLKGEFDTYKEEQNKKALRSEKEEAFKEILKDLGIPEKRFAVILRSVNLDNLEYADGKFKDEKGVKEQAKEDWGDFIVTTEETGVQTAKPPVKNPSTQTLTRADIYKKDDKGRFVMDATERQKALSAIIAAEQQKG